MELIVASLVSTTVLLGVGSLLVSYQTASVRLSKLNYVTTATQATVTRIINDATAAHGNSSDWAIRVGGSSGLSTSSFCLGTDTNTDDVNDQWTCYTQITTNIYRCQQATIVNCTAAAPSVFIGTALAGTLTATNPSYDVTNNTFSITIINRVDPSQAQSVNNPQYTASGSTSPISATNG